MGPSRPSRSVLARGHEALLVSESLASADTNKKCQPFPRLPLSNLDNDATQQAARWA